jgi:hypothetical protein
MDIVEDDIKLWVESTREPDDEPVCLFTWGTLQWYAPVAAVRQAALGLITCAAYAELIMFLVAKMNMDGKTASMFVADLLVQAGHGHLGSAETVEMVPAGSTQAKKAVVLVKRGVVQGIVETPKATEMAQQWLEAAEATESDQLIGEALRAAAVSDDSQERVFGYLRELRKAKE